MKVLNDLKAKHGLVEDKAAKRKAEKAKAKAKKASAKAAPAKAAPAVAVTAAADIPAEVTEAGNTLRDLKVCGAPHVHSTRTPFSSLCLRGACRLRRRPRRRSSRP